MTNHTWQKNITISDPPLAESLFGNTRWAWLWLIVRLYIGYTWLTSGWGKLSDPGWVQTGDNLKGFWDERLQSPPRLPARLFLLIGIEYLSNPCLTAGATPGSQRSLLQENS